MLEWLVELRTAMDREFGTRSRIMVLATVDGGGAPHARCVVCRRIDGEGRIYFVGDARTQKNIQLRADPRTEVVCWMPTIQVQFRLTGQARVLGYPEDETLRKEIWREMSDQARSVSFWPTPGIAQDVDDVFMRAIGPEVPPPRTFEVLIVEPKQVIRLALDAHPHRRRLWRAEANWAGVDVNP